MPVCFIGCFASGIETEMGLEERMGLNKLSEWVKQGVLYEVAQKEDIIEKQMECQCWFCKHSSLLIVVV